MWVLVSALHFWTTENSLPFSGEQTAFCLLLKEEPQLSWPCSLDMLQFQTEPFLIKKVTFFFSFFSHSPQWRSPASFLLHLSQPSPWWVWGTECPEEKCFGLWSFCLPFSLWITSLQPYGPFVQWAWRWGGRYPQEMVQRSLPWGLCLPPWKPPLRDLLAKSR